MNRLGGISSHSRGCMYSNRGKKCSFPSLNAMPRSVRSTERQVFATIDSTVGERFRLSNSPHALSQSIVPHNRSFIRNGSVFCGSSHMGPHRMFLDQHTVLNHRSFASKDGKSTTTTSEVASEDGMKLTASLIQRLGIPPDKIIITCGGAKTFGDAFDVGEGGSAALKNNDAGSPQEAENVKDNLPGMTPKDTFASCTKVMIPFSKEASLQNVFQRPDDPQSMRWGLLLELLDALAGDVAYLHVTPEGVPMLKTPYTIVTLSIDSMAIKEVSGGSINQEQTLADGITLGGVSSTVGYSVSTSEDFNLENRVAKTIKLDRDLTLLGYVTFVGNSSIEIRTEIFQDDGNIGKAYFVMVALDRFSGCSKKVPPLITPTNPRLLRFLNQAKARVSLRKQVAQNDSKVLPSREESELLHNLWLSSQSIRKFHENSFEGPRDLSNFGKFTWVDSTAVQSTLLMQRDKRNVHNKIFGGYLARTAFEHAFVTAQYFSRNLHPQLLAIDNIMFLKPVELGAISHLVGEVVYTNDEEFHVQVRAFQVNPVTGAREPSNEYHFSFVQEYVSQMNRRALYVIPKDYEQCMAYLSGQRRYLARISKKKQRSSSSE